MASIDRRSNGSWRVRWREYPGAPAQRTQGGFRLKGDAERFAARVEGDLVRGSYVDPVLERQPFLDYADEWASAQDWKPGTRKSWVSQRGRLEPLIGGVPLGMVDRLRLQRLQQDLLGSLDRSTTVLCMQYARAVMRAAYADGRIGQDPTRGLKMPKVRAGDRDGRVTADMVPTTEEVLAIIEAAPGPYRAAIGLGIAGLRIGEVLGMTVDRVDLDTRQVTVDRQAQRGELVPTKNDKARTIGIPEMVADELRSHPRALHGGGLLFPARTGGLLWDGSFYERGWRPALAAAGLAGRFKFHALRHYCASTLLAEGAPITAVAGHLGDVVPTVMKVYAHWLRDDRALPTDVLDRVLGPRLRIVESILSPRQPSD